MTDGKLYEDINERNPQQVRDLLNAVKKDAPTNVNEGSIRLYKYDVWFQKWFGDANNENQI